MMKKLWLLMPFFLLFSSIALAQARIDIKTFLGLLGEVPRTCLSGITPQCFTCLLYTKMFPLLFFLSIFFLIFFYIVKLMRPTTRPVPLAELLGREPETLHATEIKVVTILSVIFSLILLNVLTIRTILTQFTFWILFVIFVFGLMLARSVYRAGAIGWIALIIILIIVLVGVWSYIGAPIAAAIENWISVCV